MSDWILVPCLVTLRAEFDAVAPDRDRGSDGSIGDSNHTSASDHTPDEDSDILRDHDADDKNEVHALDIDSSGPWPGGPAWFDAAVKGIVDRHRRGEDDRLKYVIWNKQIANREIENWKWRPYHGTSDDHTGHVHFSARYTTAQESNTDPWGVDDMALTAEETTDAAIQAISFVLSEAARAADGKALATTGAQLVADRAARTWRTNLRKIVGGPTDLAPVVAAIQALDALPEDVSAEQVAELIVQKLAVRVAS